MHRYTMYIKQLKMFMYSIIFNIQLGVLDIFKRTIPETHLYLAALFDFLKFEKENK